MSANAPSNVFPVLASAAEVKRRSEQAAARGGVPSLAFGPTLAMVLVIEDGEKLTWVDAAALDALDTLYGIDAEDPFALARENLRARTARPLPRKAIANGRDAWFVGHDDGLDSGRLLLHDLWRPLKEQLPGELLVRVPLRGVVLCCSNVPADMAFVDAVADRFVENAKGAGVVATPWIAWTEEGWAEIEIEA
ncbi:MAG: hypothetical protein KF819_27735 [Labilithrix sp.]|nr:hypothetical protein [Labilithrix sp.]